MPKFNHLIALLLPIPSLWAAQQSGTVVSGGLAIPGATVTAVQGEKKIVTTTDESGRYAFADLAAGAWTVQVEMFGFSPARREITMDEKPSAIDWALDLKPLSSEAPPVSKAAPVTAPAPSAVATAPAPAPAAAPGTAKSAAAAQPRQRSGRGSQAQSGQAQSGGGFRSLSMNNTAEGEATGAAEAPAELASTDAAGGANESFLVNGSISTGLETPGQQGSFDYYRGDPNRPPGSGFGPPGGPGGPDSGAPPGFGDSGGGFSGRGGGGPPGGGGFGGRGGGGPPGGGGFSGRGGRGGDDGGRRRRSADSSQSFGNRRGRGRGGMHGSVFATLGNSEVNARPYSLNGQTLEKPSTASFRFGASVGGPLKIPHVVQNDKVFVFLNYYGTRATNPFDAFDTVPTTFARGGDFSQSTVNGMPVNVFDPTTGAPFPGNAIPMVRLDGAALGLLRFIPLPNQPGAVQNYQFVTSVPSNTDNLSTRFNYNLTPKDRINTSFSLQRRNSGSQQDFGFQDHVTGLGFSASLGWSHNLSSHTVNSVTWSFSRQRNQTTPFFAYTTDVDAQLGIKGTSTSPIDYGPPNLSFTNYGSLTDASPVLIRNQTSSVNDSVQMTRGAHNITVGGDFRRIQLNSQSDSNARGTFSFSGIGTSQLGANGLPIANTGYDFADYLLGLPQSSSVRFGSSNNYFRSSAYDGFATDDWRIRSNLTVIVGLRYEYFTPYSEKYGHLANLDIAPGFTSATQVLAGQGGFPAGLVYPDKLAFSPRVGFAWKPTRKGRLLVRGGYGIFYSGSVYNQFPSRLASQPPLPATTASLVTSAAAPLTLENGFPNTISSGPAGYLGNTYAVNPNYRMPYAQTWNFSVQREFPRSIILELSYLGVKGTDLDIQSLPNRTTPGSARALIPNAGAFTYETSVGNSIYHALQTRVTRRFQRGISAYALYTYGKSIDDASSIGGGGATVAQNANDLSAERGLSSFDRRHALTSNFILASPVGKNSPIPATGWKGRLLSDWTLSGGLTAQTGLPFTARVLGNQANAGGTGAVGAGRAEATGLPIDSGTFFNLAAFTLPAPGTFGDAGRNTIEGPGVFSLNLSFSRSFTLGDDRRRVEFRVDSVNILNHPGITGLYTVINADNYGLPSAAQAMRSLTATVRFRF